MNRRSFLGLLAGVPFLNRFAPTPSLDAVLDCFDARALGEAAGITDAIEHSPHARKVPLWYRTEVDTRGYVTTVKLVPCDPPTWRFEVFKTKGI